MTILFLQELFLFAAAQAIGLFTAMKGRSVLLEQGRVQVDLTLTEILVFVLIFGATVFLLSRFSRKSPLFFRMVLGLVIFAGSQTVFSLVSGEAVFSTLAAALLVIFVLRSKIVLFHNLGMILAVAGVGAVMGLSLTPIATVLLLLILSFYDIIAVYKTRHMVQLAENMIRARAISGIVIPQTSKDWFESLENIRPGGRFMILGSGDLIMPLILAASVAGLHGLAAGLTVFLFSSIGLFLTYFLFVTQRKKRPMAALPPIAVMAIIGYLVSIVL